MKNETIACSNIWQDLQMTLGEKFLRRTGEGATLNMSSHDSFKWYLWKHSCIAYLYTYSFFFLLETMGSCKLSIPHHHQPSFEPNFHEDEKIWIWTYCEFFKCEFWICEFWICELWFVENVNSKLFLTKLSWIDPHEIWHGWVSTYLDGSQLITLP